MGYAVCHRDAAGTPHVEDATSLDAALASVERLRNGDGAADVRLFREVPVQVRTYYKVEVADELAAADAVPVVVADVPAAPPAVGAVAAPDELPGAFALRPPPVVDVPAEPVDDVDGEHEPARRTSLFTRGG